MQAREKEEVLNALSRVAVQIRTRLGESLATIQEHSTPLEQATTTSLEALKAFSAGWNAEFTDGQPAAIRHYERAIAIDPQFAMAHASLGLLYNNMGQTDLAADHTRKAYELRDRVSDRERLFILTVYDRQVTGNCRESWILLNCGCERTRAMSCLCPYLPAGAPGAQVNMKGEFKRPKPRFG